MTGVQPGDVLEIRILKIVPKGGGSNFNLPGKDFPTIGALPAEFPEGFVKYFDIDPKTRTTQLKPGITIPMCRVSMPLGRCTSYSTSCT